MSELDPLTAKMQIITCPIFMKEVRYHLLRVLDKKGVNLSELCKFHDLSYNSWYPNIFKKNNLNLDYINEILKMVSCEHRLELINNEMHKVFQSKMNEI